MTSARPLSSRRSPAFRPGWAKVLDPSAHRVDRRPTAPTVYRPDHLLIHPTSADRRAMARSAVADRLDHRGWAAVPNGRGVHVRSSEVGGPVDAWSVLADLYGQHGAGISALVGLDHLMTTAEQLGGNPFALDHGTPGLDFYGIASYSGRGPVSAILAPLRRRSRRVPRVVVLDTGIGTHPWFADGMVSNTIEFVDGRRYGPTVDPHSITAVDAEGRGVGNHLLGLLATHSGHGTFIAGLLRQTCPEAEIVALAVMGSDGIVPESTLTDALQIVLEKQLEAPGWADALVLSLGYYTETSEDLTYTTRLGDTLARLARAGVTVFCAAGNDATTRHSYPAALAGQPPFTEKNVMPLVSVAALNPDGSVAAFSNDGPWVNAEALGVNLVSSAPIVADGSEQPEMAAAGPGRRSRAAADPDNFHTGFASWSGTSFAAPVLAGRYLNNLMHDGMPELISRRRELVPLGRTQRRSSARMT